MASAQARARPQLLRQIERPESCAVRGPKRQGGEMGALLAILFRLSSTFELIANTQRELRRAIHRLSERRSIELSNSDAIGGQGIALASRPPCRRAGTEHAIGTDDLARLLP